MNDDIVCCYLNVNQVSQINMAQCCVVGCSERHGKKSDQQISFHVFPRRERSPARYKVVVMQIF